MKIAKDLTGQTFGNWLVLERVENKNKTVYWKCECQCENKTIRHVSGKTLLYNKSKSCGCWKAKDARERFSKQRKANNYVIENDTVVFKNGDGNKEFVIDKEDLELTLSIKMCWVVNKEGYVRVRKNKKDVKLHNLIMNPPEGFLVDHIDGNPRNNKKENLRICKEIDNAKNKRTPSNNTSGCKGVYWYEKSKTWCARIGINNKRILLGYFISFDDAVKVRKDAEIRYFGEYKNNR